MLIVRRKPSRRQATMERRCDFHLGEAIRAALAGSYDKAETHSSTALSISRELYARTGKHRHELAAALASQAVSSSAYGRLGETVALLTESAGHYAALADADPVTYEVPRIDVLTRVAVAADVAGSATDAIALLREVVRMYHRTLPTACEQARAERDLGLARARFHLGNCLLKSGARDEALAEIDAGLADAERAWETLGLSSPELSGAPRCVLLTAPDWATAAVRAMALHAGAGRPDDAAAAARVAVRMSAGLAGLGGDTQREAHAAIHARASALWAQEEHQERATAATRS